MKTKNIALIITVIVLIIAAITNPNQQVHKDKVKAVLTAKMQQSMANKNSEAAGFAALGNMMADGIINTMINNMITSDSYMLFSLTKVTYDGKSKTIGFGVFGNVWLSKDINDAMEKSNNIEN